MNKEELIELLNFLAQDNRVQLFIKYQKKLDDLINKEKNESKDR